MPRPIPNSAAEQNSAPLRRSDVTAWILGSAACWDILGKSLGVPIHQLLGGQVRVSLGSSSRGS